MLVEGYGEVGVKQCPSGVKTASQWINDCFAKSPYGESHLFRVWLMTKNHCFYHLFDAISPCFLHVSESKSGQKPVYGSGTASKNRGGIPPDFTEFPVFFMFFDKDDVAESSCNLTEMSENHCFSWFLRKFTVLTEVLAQRRGFGQKKTVKNRVFPGFH